MPLALQALLPFIALLGAAAIVRQRPRDQGNGWIAAGATGLAAVIALVELLRLSPGEHVDVPYLTTFPYADLSIRLDGLSLAFATIALITGALLMLARQRVRGDRRDPWAGWLLTSAATCAVILADNLLLVYIALQLLTLAWSGALDEASPRRRGLRLTVQVADIGLLLAAASAIQSVGTSAFSGVPSDTFGLATFVLVLVAVVVRIGALIHIWGGPKAAVAFEPAIAWLAPAGYLLLRLLALMGGRLPDRATAVALFAVGVIGALVFAGFALFTRAGPRLAGLLLAAQAGLAISLSTGDQPLLTVASTWLWLLLVPLAGLAGVRPRDSSPPDALTLLGLAMVPGSVAFVGLWLAGLALNARGLLFAMIPVGLVVVVSLIAALRHVTLRRLRQLDVATAWAGVLLLIAAFPIIAIGTLVVPAAATVRLVPRGMIAVSPFGLVTGFGVWPALAVSVVVGIVLGLTGWRLQGRLPLRV
ncbi:MAG: multicomponent Na+:H+ antiporter subunit, partial [Chloroflexota bacterium]|nr:multicomponent Na+:H+ antiporter subunit [Chloroflexota bacterium]